MAVEVEHTELGTRILLLKDGTTLSISKGEKEIIELRIGQSRRQVLGGARIEVLVRPEEALSLIEHLAVAARPNTGVALIEMEAGDPQERPCCLASRMTGQHSVDCTLSRPLDDGRRLPGRGQD